MALRSHKPLGRPHSSKFGTVNYSTDEMRRLVEKVRAVMPVSSEDWLHVAYQFNYMRPESIPYREVESLKRKFKKMYCSRASGNSKLPDYVVEAKELRRLINQRTDASAASTSATTPFVDTAATALEETASNTSSHNTDGAPPTTATCGAGEDITTEDSGRDLSARLNTMEDEYITPSPAASRRSTASSVTMGASDAWSSSPSMAVDSTNGIINLLRHSIERKRRTVEEQLLSESERVRKERKKRKMEQALYNIHREHEMMASSTAPQPPAGAPPSMESSSSTVDPAFASLPPTSAATPPPAFSSLLGPMAYAPSALQSDASSLGVMEVLLQFMLVQQQENTRRWQELEERRRKAEAVARRRRRADARRRRRDKHELMALMARLFQGDFPEALKHYVDPAYVDVSSDDHDDDDGDAASDSDNRATSAGDSSATTSAAAMSAVSSATSAGTRSADQAATTSMNIVTDVVL
ncbi:hypothetical protein PINS_up014509 [Pythium insidiosum]|nr:hypothetical protein PINS_up014509 [Pythium insidiosum]